MTALPQQWYAIATGESGHSMRKVLQYRSVWSAQGYDLPDLVVPVSEPAHTQRRQRQPVPMLGDLYAAELQKLFNASWLSLLPGNKKGCQACKNLQEQMNRGGVRYAIENRDYIIDATAANAAQVNSWIPAAVAGLYTGSSGCRAKIAAALDNVIATASPTKRPANRARSAGGFASAFRSQGKPRFVTAAQMQEDIKILIGKIPSSVTAIAGVARSGLSAATMVSMYLHLPMFTIRQNSHDIQQTGNGWRLGGTKHIEPGNQHVLIVDDTVMTGNSLKAIAGLAKQFKKTTTAAVYVNPAAKQKPDIWAVDLPWPHLLEWNLFNSILSPNMALDFDGILCQDCPPGSDDDGPKYREFIRNAKPLYVPRRTPIPLIVTARVEKYRAETQAWLDRHGMKCNRLVMHPASGTREREKDNIAAWKARHFLQWANQHRPVPPPLAFIESDDRQAQQIASISKKMVICPGSAKVY